MDDEDLRAYLTSADHDATVADWAAAMEEDE